MDKDISPEEKLLNLIKPEEKTGPSGEKDKETDLPEKNKHEPADFLHPSTGDFSLNKLNRINKILKILVITFIPFLFAQLFFHLWNINRFKRSRIKKSSLSIHKTVSDTPPINPDSLESEFQGRQLFKVFFLTEPPKTTVRKQSANELIRHFQLSGIIMEEKPTAIIYDQKMRQNTYVREGDTINNMEVINITNNSVTFLYEDEEIELSL